MKIVYASPNIIQLNITGMITRVKYEVFPDMYLPIKPVIKMLNSSIKMHNEKECTNQKHCHLIL